MPVIRKEISDHQFVVERVNKNAFPKVGKANTLYVDKESGIVYRFDSPKYIGVGTVDLTPYELQSNKVIAWSSTTNNTRYPSEKLVKDSLDAINVGLENIGSLSPLRFAGYFTGGTGFNDFNNLIRPFENLTNPLPDFYINNVQGAMFVCSAASEFDFHTVYYWSTEGKTTPITFNWAAPYDEGIGTTNFKVGDTISILKFAYDTVENEMRILIKVEKNLDFINDYVEEALNDGKTYARKNKSWVEVTSGGGYDPDGVTIILNNSNELEVSKDLEVEWTKVVNKPTIPTVTNDLTNALKSNYDAAYTHSTEPHAPSNAQKNSDITKAEIEAKLKLKTINGQSLLGTGDITEVGPKGDNAGFGTPIATIDANVGTPSVTITASGPDTAKIFTFGFKNLKGVQGNPGNTGPRGYTFTPSVNAAGVISWTNEGGLTNPASVNIKGPQGEKGPQGNTGPQGERGIPGIEGVKGEQGPRGYKGDQGYTFTPSVSAAGVISWTNNGGLTDPSSINIKGPKGDPGIEGLQGIRGPQGEKGPQGNTGPRGNQGYAFTPSVSAAGLLSWTNDGGLDNPTSVNIKGPQGEKGPQGNTGPQGERGIPGIEGLQGIRGPQGEKGPQGNTGPRGNQGYAFTPSVNAAGLLSWTNEGGLTNPASVNIKGPQGEKGPQGNTGPQGERGIPGIEGVKGEQGPRGYKGDQGYTFTPSVSAAGVISWTNNGGLTDPSSINIKGPKGDPGIEGLQGIRGPQGEKGPQGNTGPRGNQGYAFTPSVSAAGLLSWTNDGGLDNPTSVNIKGPQGEKGPQGNTGPQGERGIPGIEGLQGIRGPQGEKGPQGNTGPRGNQGYAFTPSVNAAGLLSWTNDGGLDNPTSVNIKGPQGEKGPQGNTGPQGERGIPGIEGLQGIRGPQGEKGPQGNTGPRGNQGYAFTPSVSAAGLLSWTNDGGLTNPSPLNIKGPQGEKGPQGNTGPQGEKGDQGPQGPKGDTGAKGDTGPQGPASTVAGPKGDKGDKGDQGPAGTTPSLTTTWTGATYYSGPKPVINSTTGDAIPPATNLLSGVLTATTQSIGGTKTFSNAPVISDMDASRIVYINEYKKLASVAAGTNGQVLTMDGSSAFKWTTPASGGGGGFEPTLLHTKVIGDGDIDFPCDYLTGFGMASTSGWFMLEFYFFNSDLYIPQTHTFIIKGAPAFGTTFPVVSVSNVNVSVFGEGNSSQTSIMLRLEGNPNHYESMTNCTMKIYSL